MFFPRSSFLVLVRVQRDGRWRRQVRSGFCVELFTVISRQRGEGTKSKSMQKTAAEGGRKCCGWIVGMLGVTWLEVVGGRWMWSVAAGCRCHERGGLIGGFEKWVVIT